MGMSIAGPGADLGGSENSGDLESVRDMRFGPGPGAGPLEGGAEFGDERPESGRAGELEPDTEALLVRRQSFLMLFTLISDDCLAAALPSSDASESIENRLDDGAEDALLILLLCACRVEDLCFAANTESSCRAVGASRSEGNLPNGSGDKGITGESDPGLRNRAGATKGG